MSNYIINISDGQRYSTPVVNRFSSDFDRIRFVLDLSKDLSSYSFGIVAAVCGECFMITEDDEKLVKGTEEATGRITLDWSVGTEITAKDGVVIYQIIAFSADAEGNMKSIWYSPEGRVTVGESIELTTYETAEIGSRPSIVMQLLAKVSSNELSFSELRDADSTHKTEVILDHPDGSVIKAKLSADVIKILDEAVSKKHFEDIVSPLSDDVALLDENFEILDRRMTGAEESISDCENSIAENRADIDKSIIIADKDDSILYINDSANCKIRRLNIYGCTKQNTSTGKNMIPYPYYDGMTKTENGITFIVNDDSSITFNGTATGRTVFRLYSNSTKDSTNSLESGGTYALSAGSVMCNNLTFSLEVTEKHNYNNGTVSTETFSDIGQISKTHTISKDVSDAYFTEIQIVVASGFNANNITVYPMLEKNTKPSAFESCTNGSLSPSPEYPEKMVNLAENNVEIEISGKNLFDKSRFVEYIKSYDSTAEEVVVDGRNCIKFDIFRLYKKDFSEVFRFDRNKIHTWSMDVKFHSKYSASYIADVYLTFGFLYYDEKSTSVNIGSTIKGIPITNRSFWCSMNKYEKFGKVTLTSYPGAPVNGIAFSYNDRGYWLIDLDSIQIEEGNIVSDYEPYIKQNMTVSIPGVLAGVPVMSGGNYTDKNGQQWVCDEIDLARGVYIQRIGSSTLPDFSFVYLYNGTDAGDIYEGFAPCAFPCTDTGALCEKATYTDTWSGYRATQLTLTPTTGVDGYCDLAVQCIAENEEDFRNKLKDTAVLYILSTPIEKALSDEEISAYNILQTYKPSTTVFNDACAHMAISYAADPKNYIDGKIAALMTATMPVGGDTID